MLRARPLGMVSRIVLVLLAAVLLEFLGNLAVHRLEHRALVSAEQSARIAGKLADGRRVAIAAPRRDRARLMRALSGDELVLNWVPNTVVTDVSGALEPLAAMRERLVTEAPDLSSAEMRLSLLPSDQPGRRDLIGILALPDRSFVTFRVRGFLRAPLAPGVITALHMMMMLAVMAIALLMVRALTRPLRDLATAADATGRGEPAPIVPSGPHEVRRVASAFAAMQTRLVCMVEDHAQALVAVSHDLRTPLQRIRLRTAMLRDDGTREAINHDLAEVERFIESTLAYVRSGDDEAPRLIDAAALIATIVDDSSDLGTPTSFVGPERLEMTTRRTALHRMLNNLLDNGRRYADRIVVTLEPGETCATITVDDDGPGIAPELREQAMLPFRRLGQEHREADGAGLGLASARRIAERLGGSLTLHDSPLGGLRVTIEVPLHP